jgi:dienelactone hydrolase
MKSQTRNRIWQERQTQANDTARRVPVQAANESPLPALKVGARIQGLPRAALFFSAVTLCVGSGHAAEPLGPIKILKTPGGVRFGLIGEKGSAPAPTLIVLASSIEETLGDGYYVHAGRLLAPQGYLLASVDLPCHGQWVKAGDAPGLAGWSQRLARGEPIIDELNRHLSEVLDYLIAEHYSDETRIAVAGTSRGGFAALHFAGHDKRVRCVAAYAPVTDLGVVSDFRAAASMSAVRALDLTEHPDALAGRPVWLVIGDHDDRVSTDKMIAYGRALSHAAYAQKIPSQVEIHVFPEPGGHTTPKPSDALSAAWIAAQLKSGPPPKP